MSKVLVVVDMQNDFVTGSLGTKEAQAIVPNVVAKVKEYMISNLPIYTTQDTHDANYLETMEGKNLPVEHCIVDTDGCELIPELEKEFDFEMSEDFILRYAHLFSLEKETFGSTDLPIMMKRHHLDIKEITEIEIIGVCTDICVISNALLIKANFPNTKVVVDASCCAGVTPESHQKALDTLKMCQIEVINEPVTISKCNNVFVSYDVVNNGYIVGKGDVVVELSDENTVVQDSDLEKIRESIKVKKGNPASSTICINSIQKLPLF